MNKKLLLLLAWLPMLIMGQTSVDNTIMVIADPHVMANTLSDNGEAFDSMMINQRKMLDISEIAFTSLIDTALLYHPSLVLIPGDLTKDGELESHSVVLTQLERLQDAGIKTLVIPGNHDIGGRAYKYQGTNKTIVETLSDENWESTYSMIYEQAIAKDTHSHSYVAEPLSGVTIIGINATHNNGEGSLSDSTLTWILQQADDAHQKGNMIIAMCHWQLLDHVDEGGMMIESGLLQNSETVRNSLMEHGVRLVLTGHMHVNSISTYRDTINISTDSIVEISTGSPITYPCPYRWITVSNDNSSLTVETMYLNSLPGYEDLTTYSRTWMQEHTMNSMAPLSIKLFDNAALTLENKLTEMMQGSPMGSMVVAMMKNMLPKTDEGKNALINKHLANTITELYLLHSIANEPEHAEADSLAQAFYNGISDMIHELSDAVLKNYQSVQEMLISAVINSRKASIQSLVEDRTNWASETYSNQTDDLYVELRINKQHQATDIEDSKVQIQEDSAIYDILGRRISHSQLRHGMIYIQNGKKFIVH